MNRIGVIVATYNGERYIDQQLSSIIKQTMKPDLIVVSDGGSQDKTVSICNDILGRFGITFKILASRDHLTVSKNFEKAFQECNCEYIFFADQDDVWDTKKIEIMINEMEARDAVLCFTNASIVDETLCSQNSDLWNRVGYHQNKDITVYNKSDPDFFRLLLQHNIVTGMCMCVRSSIKEYILPFSEKTIHDVWVSLIATNIGSVIGIDKKCVLYRQHANNVIGTNKTLRRSFLHARQYRESVINRLELMRDLEKKLDDIILDDNINLLHEYIDYLTERVQYVNKERALLSVFKHIKQYKRFDYNYIQILVRDIICRLIFDD